MPGGDGDIYERIVNKLDNNGTMDNREWRQLVLLALVDLGRTQQVCKIGLAEMQIKVKNLEDNCILLFIRRHPKSFGMLALGLIVLTIATIIHLGLGGWLLDVFDIPPIPTVTP